MSEPPCPPRREDDSPPILNDSHSGTAGRRSGNSSAGARSGSFNPRAMPFSPSAGTGPSRLNGLSPEGLCFSFSSADSDDEDGSPPPLPCVTGKGKGIAVAAEKTSTSAPLRAGPSSGGFMDDARWAPPPQPQRPACCSSAAGRPLRRRRWLSFGRLQASCKGGAVPTTPMLLEATVGPCRQLGSSLTGPLLTPADTRPLTGLVDEQARALEQNDSVHEHVAEVSLERVCFDEAYFSVHGRCTPSTPTSKIATKNGGYPSQREAGSQVSAASNEAGDPSPKCAHEAVGKGPQQRATGYYLIPAVCGYVLLLPSLYRNVRL